MIGEEISAEPERNLAQGIKPAPEIHRGTTETTLIRLWHEILGVHPIGRNDDLFDLGATSLTMVMALTAIEQEMSVQIDMEAMFTSPTIAEQAHLIEAALSDESNRQP